MAGGLDAYRRDGAAGVERDAFGFPVYPTDGGLAAVLRSRRPAGQQRRLEELRALTPETVPERAPATLTPEQAALMGIGMVPGIGDAVGVAADAYTLATDPEARTLGNAALAAAGLLPFVPSGLGTVRRVLDDTTPARRVAKTATTQAGRSANGTVAVSEMGVDAGGGLPMDEASRMQRAREMGFLPQEVYHGTRQDFLEFSPDSLGSATGAPSATQGYFFSGRPRTAESYTEMVLPSEKQAHDALYKEGTKLHSKAIRMLPDEYVPKRKVKQSDILEEARNKITAAAEMRRSGGNILPSRVRMTNPMEYDMGGKAYREQTYYDLIQKAKDNGHDGLIIRNTYDAVKGDELPDDIYVTFDPRNIRSRFAAFDPAKANSADLLASVAPAAAAGGAAALYALSPEEAEARGLSEDEHAALMQYVLSR